MDEVVQALHDQVDELDDLVGSLTAAELARESACPGWSLSDVLVHLAQTNEAATASVEGRWDEAVGLWADAAGETIDDVVAAAVEGDARRRAPGVVDWWKRSADDMVAAFDLADPRARVPWVAGEMAARTLCTTRLTETWIHTVDIADGLGVTIDPTDRLWHVARLVHRTLPYAFARAGRPAPTDVRFDLVAPDGSEWVFGPDDAPSTVAGSARELCAVAGQRAQARDTALVGSGPDGPAVLELMRTFA